MQLHFLIAMYTESFEMRLKEIPFILQPKPIFTAKRIVNLTASYALKTYYKIMCRFLKFYM